MPTTRPSRRCSQQTFNLQSGSHLEIVSLPHTSLVNRLFRSESSSEDDKENREVGTKISMAEFYCEFERDRSNQGKTSYPNFIARWTRSAETPKDANWQFYQGKLRSQPDGATIEEMHSWYHDMDKLERKHGYIQWLFPVSGSSGQNEESQPLQPAEAEAIKSDEAAQKRLLKSYEMMLNFYGMQIHDYWTGELRPAPHWKKRFANLNGSTHNHMRITRIIKSIGELGLERYQFSLVKILLQQAVLTEELRDTLPSCKKYWIPAVRNDMERATLLQRCHDYEFESRRKAELERFAAIEATTSTPVSAQSPDKRFQPDASQQPQNYQDASIDQLLSIDQAVDLPSRALPLTLVPTVPCQALPNPAPATKRSDPATPRASAAETKNPTTATVTGTRTLNPPAPRTTVAKTLNPSTPRSTEAMSLNLLTSKTTGDETLNPSPLSAQSPSKGLFIRTKPPENADPSSTQKAKYKEDIFLFTMELFDIWNNLDRLVREPSAEMALETGTQLSELVRLTDTLKKVSTKLEFTSMELGVLVSKDFSQKNCKRDVAKKVLEPAPSAAAQPRSYIAPTISRSASADYSSLSEKEQQCQKENQQSVALFSENSLSTTDAEKSSFAKENLQNMTQQEQCLAANLDDWAADEELNSIDSCAGELTDHVPDAVSVCGDLFQEVRMSLLEADQPSLIQASHHADSLCADQGTARTISFIVIDPSDESCSGELIDGPDHN